MKYKTLQAVLILITLQFLAVRFLIAAPAEAQIQTRIINGTEAPESAWPFMVGLYKGSRSGASRSFTCGGAIIDPYHILTAAHCVTDDVGKEHRASQFSARYGAIDLFSREGVHVSVADIVVHPNYRSSTFRNDIAILRLKEKLPVEEVLLTYPADTGLTAQGMKGTILGWGSTDPDNSFTVSELREAEIDFGSSDVCEDTFGNIFSQDTMICAGVLSSSGREVDGVDTCYGDSGGPLLVASGSGWRIAGITSWGLGCASDKYYGVYTRVSSFRSWIDDQVLPYLSLRNMLERLPDLMESAFAEKSSVRQLRRKERDEAPISDTIRFLQTLTSLNGLADRMVKTDSNFSRKNQRKIRRLARLGQKMFQPKTSPKKAGSLKGRFLRTLDKLVRAL